MTKQSKTRKRELNKPHNVLFMVVNITNPRLVHSHHPNKHSAKDTRNDLNKDGIRFKVTRGSNHWRGTVL